jgi:hypothetical protein
MGVLIVVALVALLAGIGVSTSQTGSLRRCGWTLISAAALLLTITAIGPPPLTQLGQHRCSATNAGCIPTGASRP